VIAGLFLERDKVFEELFGLKGILQMSLNSDEILGSLSVQW
jgi:hypothetical protein